MKESERETTSVCRCGKEKGREMEIAIVVAVYSGCICSSNSSRSSGGVCCGGGKSGKTLVVACCCFVVFFRFVLSISVSI